MSPSEPPEFGNATFLVVANLGFVSHVDLATSAISVLVDVPSGGAFGIDYDYR